jgi:hypothetical protein
MRRLMPVWLGCLSIRGGSNAGSADYTKEVRVKIPTLARLKFLCSPLSDSSFLTFPERTTQFALKDLACTRHRQWIGTQIDAARTLVAADALLTEIY